MIQLDLPKQWKMGIIYCIPKSAEWSGDMADVRPITLLEHSRKLLFSILTERLSRIFSRHNVLRGPNFSVLKGTTTMDPLHILNAVLEDARAQKKELWVVFQDMRRCFDSVNCSPGGMLARGLQRLKVPQAYIQLCMTMAATKINRVITEYGLTEEYHPQCGLDQGGVECPLHWRIAYDPLLCEVMEPGIGYSLDSHKGNITIHALAFVDDTTWISDSRPNMQSTLDIAQSFFNLHGVEINAKKTELLVINPNKSVETPLQFGNPPSALIPKGPRDSTRILGVWVSASGTP
jgi:hypothetical protein